MKKFWAMLSLLALLMGMVPVACAEEANDNIFEPSLLNAMEFTASEWYESENSRGLLALLMAADLANALEDFDANTALIDNPSYVGYIEDDEQLVVALVQEEGVYCIIYIPESGQALRLFQKSASIEDAEQILETLCDSYEENTEEAIEFAIRTLAEALEE